MRHKQQITVIGAGYVGLVTAACLAEIGNRVACVDADAERVALLTHGEVPFFEPGLRELIARNARLERLRFLSSTAQALDGADFVFIAVGTPMNSDGSCDLSAVKLAARQIGESLSSDAIVVLKSTVPVGTADAVSAILRECGARGRRATIVSNPEFLREGSAIADFRRPDRVIIGAQDPAAVARMRALYAPLRTQIVVTDIRTSEMIKYASNAFLATKISFINEIADLCERVGADVTGVIRGAGADRRIGTASFNAGLGFGGSCFPKDVSALIESAQSRGLALRLLPAVLEINRGRIESVVNTLRRALGGIGGRRVAVLGLAFKPKTDDVRESPALALIAQLLERGAIVSAHDPVAVQAAGKVLGERVRLCTDAYAAAEDVDAVLIATEWEEYARLDFSLLKQRMSGDLVIDARNACDALAIVGAGLRYIGVGRVTPRAVHPLPSRAPALTTDSAIAAAL